jgi:hypothetical protein
MRLKQVTMLSLIICLSIFLSCENSSKDSATTSTNEKSKTDKKNSGVNKVYRKNGTLLSEVSYVNGLKDGVAINYYENGIVQLKIDYKADKMHGKHLYYYEDGTLYKSSDYENDKLNGLVQYYREDGSLKIKIPYKDGKPGVGFEEYALSGEVKKYLKELDIVIREQNTVALNDQYSLYFSLTDYSEVKDVYYYIGELTNGQFLNDDLENLYTQDGRAESHSAIEPGHFLMKTITVVAEITSREDHPIILKKSFNVSVENRR